MAEILSQEEIDALLSAVSDGDVPVEEPRKKAQKKTVAVYDFSRPDRVSKDQMRTLQMIHESFARIFSTSLAAHLRSAVEVNLVSVDQLTYAEFIMSLPNPTCINILSIASLEGKAILEINPTLVFSIIDRLLGGRGQPIKENRELTEIEQKIIERYITLVLEVLKESWQRITPLDFKLESRETNPQFTQIVAPGETVVLIAFEIKAGQGSGIMSICIPYVILAPLAVKLSAQHWISASQKEGNNKENLSLLRSNLERTKIDFTALLGTTTMTIQDLIRLQVEDVICLDTTIDDKLVLKVGNLAKFYGYPGLQGRKKAMRIVSKIDEEEGEING